MDIKDLEQLRALQNEIKLTQSRIKKYSNKKTSSIVTDIVKGSSKEFPYSERNFTIQGHDNLYNTAITRNIHLLLQQKIRLEERITEIEKFINTIDDSEIRQILTLRYIEGRQWNVVARKIYGVPNGDTARKKLSRYLDKK